MFMLLGLLNCWRSAGVHVAGVVTLWFECWCSRCWGCYIVGRVLVFMLLVLFRCGLSADVHVAGIVTLWLECWCSCC